MTLQRFSGCDPPTYRGGIRSHERVRQPMQRGGCQQTDGVSVRYRTEDETLFTILESCDRERFAQVLGRTTQGKTLDTKVATMLINYLTDGLPNGDALVRRWPADDQTHSW